MAGTGTATIGENATMSDNDTGGFLSSYNLDGTPNPDREEAHFEVSVVPR